ncbi:sporulation integral membrane protein YtvI [Anaerolentibacter hominis]|uniref:sporulation integral membrane protein YtvI n=1 Tax=Anaerolentibacter hominis TaxID=3079009 RepID=UPI0031B85CE2
MEGNKKIYGKILANILMHIIGALLLIFVAPRLLGFFWPFVVAWIIALIANPLVKFLDKKVNIRRKHSSVIIIILVLGIVVGLLYLIISFLIKEIASLVNNWPEIYAGLEVQFNAAFQHIQGFYTALPEGIQNVVNSLFTAINDFVSNLFSGAGGMSAGSIAGFAGSATRNVAGGLLNTLIVFLSSYFFIAERDNMSKAFRKALPEPVMEKYDMVLGYFKSAVGGYLSAQFKIMLILIVVMTVWFAFMRVPYYFLLALGIGFLDFLPVFGTGFVLWPWALYCLVTGDYVRVIALAVLYVVCQVLHQLLQPKMVGDSIGLSPLMTLFLLFIGYQFKGILGMIIALPIGLVLINFYRAGTFDNLIKGIRIIWNDLGEYLKY